MGNDGGSIPDRRDLVKTKAKAEQTDKQNQILAKWFYCALSKRELQEPVVSCELGKLYNKDAIVEYLLDKTTYGDGQSICGHVKGLKDIVELKLTPNPSPSSTSADHPRAPFICPLTLKEMNGALPFVYIATCGHVFSASGLRAMSSPAELPSPPTGAAAESASSASKPGNLLCPQCLKPYDKASDVRTLNPDKAEEEKMREAMEERRAARKAAAGKGKKRKAAEMQNGDAEKAGDSGDHKRAKTGDATALPSKAGPPTAGGAKMNASVTAMTKKLANTLAEEEMKRKERMSDAVASLYAPKNASKSKDTFMTRGTFTRYA